MTSMRPDVPYVIRPAKAGDVAGCAYVHHTSWFETYATLLPAAHWETDTLESRTARWHRWLDGGALVTVAERGERIIGIAIDGAGRKVGENEPVRERELYSLYVLADHHGTGVGQALLETVLAPRTPAQVWVAEENKRARRFYERNEFLPDGARHVDERLGLAEVRHVR